MTFTNKLYFHAESSNYRAIAEASVMVSNGGTIETACADGTVQL